MKAFLKPLLAVFLLAAIGYGTFFAVHTLRERTGGEPQAVAETPTPQPGETQTPVAGETPTIGELQAAELEAIIAGDAAKPRFNGELLGIYIAPSQDAVPAGKYGTDKICLAGSVEVPWEQAAQFNLSVQLPPEFVFQPDDIETGLGACVDDGRILGAEWVYEYREPQFGDYPIGRLIIARSIFSYDYPNAAVDRVKVIEAGGRPAILIEPIRPEGVDQLGPTGTIGEVIFPEPFGMTTIHSYGVPLTILLQVADIVGQATK